MSADLYILGDADRVRERIESQLLAGNLVEVTKISARLTSALAKLVLAVEERLHGETIMAGGDDVLFRVHANAYSTKTLEEVASQFHAETGCSISFGVGDEVALAYLNLRKAKAAGGGIVVRANETEP